jgi:hypothetical protein
MAAAEISTIIQPQATTFPFDMEILDSIPTPERRALEQDIHSHCRGLDTDAKNSTSRGVACCLVADSRGRKLQILTDKRTARIARRE